MTLTKILLATDGSSSALHAAEWIGEHFDLNWTTIHIVTVVEPIYHAARGTFVTWDATTVAPGEPPVDAQEILRLTHQRLENFRVTTTICHGDPVSQLLEQSHAVSADLMVVGHRGLHGVERFFLGSVAKSLVLRVKTPILVIPEI